MRLADPSECRVPKALAGLDRRKATPTGFVEKTMSYAIIGFGKIGQALAHASRAKIST